MMRRILIGALLALILSDTQSFAQSKIYTDNNQYFAVIPPQGWATEDNPSETIRSKVTFRHPSLNLLIRVTAEPTLSTDFTFDDLYSQHKVRQAQMREKYPGGNYQMKPGSLGELRAVVHRNSYPNGDEHEMLSAVDNGIIYTIGLNAASLKEFNTGRKPFEGFLRSFVTLSKRKSFSDAEIKASLVAKYRRLAELSNLQGKTSEALEFINQGLALDPSNAELKAMVAETQPTTQSGEGTPYKDTKYGFSIVFPPWEHKPSVSDDVIAKVVYKTSTEFAMMTVTVEDVPEGSFISDSYLEQLKNSLRKKGLSYDDAGIESISGEQSVWLKQTIKAISMTSISYSFIKGNKLFTIHASSDPSQFTKFEKVFKKSIRSFRFTK